MCYDYKVPSQVPIISSINFSSMLALNPIFQFLLINGKMDFMKLFIEFQ